MSKAQVFLSKTLLTGGSTLALDYIDGDLLALATDDDWAFVPVSGVLYVYKLNRSSSASESSPDVIVPDTNPGTKRWELQATGKIPIDLTAKTTTGTLSAADMAGNCLITNTGAGGNIELTLLPGAADLAFEFEITAAHELKFTAAGSNAFKWYTTVGAAGGSLYSSTIGTRGKVSWNGANWSIDCNGPMSMTT